MRKQIAVVEDTPDTRLLLTKMLEDFYELTVYEDGITALAGIGQTVPDLVLLDIMLPGIDGTEVLLRLRADPLLAHLPVIALTGRGMKDDRAQYLSLGFDAYLIKPIVDENELLELVARLLPRAQ
jgi:two-component system cell cycle response regulator DivK